MNSGSSPIAWLTHSGRIYAAEAERSTSAISSLIEKICAAEAESENSRARSILRERIFSNQPASFCDAETVKVTAKRFTAPVEIPPLVADLLVSENALSAVDMRSYETRFTDLPLARGQLLLNDEVAVILSHLQKQSRLATNRWNSDRPVSALLLGKTGVLLAWAWNTHSVIRTRHAEWSLCSALAAGDFGDLRKIPVGATLYVSLKPCRMCAARIWECAEDPGQIRVVYFENDPGPLAQDTLLEKESAARRRFLGTGHPLYRFENQFQATVL